MMVKKPNSDPDKPRVHTTSSGGNYITTLDAITSKKGRELIERHNRMWANLKTQKQKLAEAK